MTGKSYEHWITPIDKGSFTKHESGARVKISFEEALERGIARCTHCGLRGPWAGVPTHTAGYYYIRGRASRCKCVQNLCDDHAAKFCAKHGVEVER